MVINEGAMFLSPHFTLKCQFVKVKYNISLSSVGSVCLLTYVEKVKMSMESSFSFACMILNVCLDILELIYMCTSSFWLIELVGL